MKPVLFGDVRIADIRKGSRLHFLTEGQTVNVTSDVFIARGDGDFRFDTGRRRQDGFDEYTHRGDPAQNDRKIVCLRY